MRFKALLQSHEHPPVWRWVSLLYLIFAFLPMFYWPQVPLRWALLFVAAALVFVVLYFAHHYAVSRRRRVALTLAVAALGFVTMPMGAGAAYVIYAVGMAAASLPVWRALTLCVAVMAIEAVCFYRFMPIEARPLSTYMINVIVAAMVFVGVVSIRNRELRNAELRLTQDEVRRLAGLAERERIGRDLHDLLGHTLSLVVLKTQLAARLFDRDPQGARAQIGEVERVAREALTQVREAVAGIRASGLQAELAAARLALLGAEISLDHRLAPVEIPEKVETALTLALRESVTNVLRHSGATRVEVELIGEARGGLSLLIADDGRGGAGREGHGLTGMRERLRAVGGSVEIDSPPGAGTRLRLILPREALAAARRSDEAPAAARTYHERGAA
ncbi:sensor histidine kinase [Lysobacter silvisoli]|uniref:Sensor histidine kinase n=1 Tax=Lysobacter silvisoli TaxID=2293254 RepID=A0A371K577_9GAMM|nr:sensor histidine kinase [Lysobacter silvisoli]RDZ29089.1 sensor histidine kinase [Lysobacter silvisoli]